MVDPLSLGNSTRSMVAWSWGYGLHLKSIYPGEMSKPHSGPTRRDSPEPPCRFGRRVPHAVRVKVERWRRRHHRVREIENKVERERESESDDLSRLDEATRVYPVLIRLITCEDEHVLFMV
jgi:hypothetical protein